MNFANYLNKILENVFVNRNIRGGVRFNLPNVPVNTTMAASIFGVDQDPLSMKMTDFNESVYSNILHFETNLEDAKTNNKELDEDKKLNEVEYALNRLIDVPAIKERVAGADGEISIEELKAYIAEVSGKDGDVESLSMADIEQVVKEMNIDLEQLLANEEAEVEEKIKAQDDVPQEVNPQDKPVNENQNTQVQNNDQNQNGQPVVNNGDGNQTGNVQTSGQNVSTDNSQVNGSQNQTPVQGSSQSAPTQGATPVQGATPTSGVEPGAPATAPVAAGPSPLETKLQTLKAKQPQLETALANKKAALEAAKTASDQKIAQTKQDMDAKKVALDKAMEKETPEVKAAVKAITDANENIAKTEGELGDQKAVVGEKDAALATANSQLNQLMDSVANQMSSLSALKAKNLDSEDPNYANWQDQVRNAEAQVAQGKRDVASKKAEIAQLEAEKQIAEAEVARLEELLETHKQAKAEAEEALEALKDQMSENAKQALAAYEAASKNHIEAQQEKTKNIAAASQAVTQAAAAVKDNQAEIVATEKELDAEKAAQLAELEAMEAAKVVDGEHIYPHEGQEVPAGKKTNIDLLHEQYATKVKQENVKNAQYGKLYYKHLPEAIGQKLEALGGTDAEYEFKLDDSGQYSIQITGGQTLKDDNKCRVVETYDDDGNIESTQNSFRDGKFTLVDANGNETVIAEAAPDILQCALPNDGCDAYIEYNQQTGGYDIVQKDLDNLPDITEIRTSYDGDSSVQVTTFGDGRVVKSTLEGSTIVKSEVITPSAETQPVDNEEPPLHVPVPISFNLPADAPQAAKEFAQSLIDNKAQIMAELKLDNDQYNLYAQAAIAIAGQETNFGETTVRSLGKDYVRAYDEGLNAVASFVMGEEVDISGKDWSRGMTQLKFSLHTQDPQIKAEMESFGITDEYQLEDPATSAIATVVMLSHMDKWAQNSKYQDGIAAAQGMPVRYENWSMGENGIAVKQEGVTETYSNNITDIDVLCAFWNGGSKIKEMANGTFKPQAYEYMRNVHTFMNEYTLVEDPADRAAAVEREAETRAFTNMKNNGEIGGIVFMPGMYNNSKSLVNTPQEIQVVDQSLRAKNVSDVERTQFIAAMQNGEIAFEHGVDPRELEAIQAVDVRQILRHVNKLRIDLSGINTSDGISASEAKLLRTRYDRAVAKAEREYQQEYLNNHSGTVAYRTSPNVLTQFSTYDVSNESYMDANGNRKVFRSATGEINTRTKDGQVSEVEALLAQSSFGIVSQNPTNRSTGHCLTGVKSAFTNAGVDVSGMEQYGNTPKMVVNWFDANNDKFTRIDYVDNGNGTARRINSSDIRRLPAGYVVIYIPDGETEAYALKEGHIGITTGNGSINSDFSDNTNWGNLAKGEHGSLKVYKLSPGWYVGSDKKLHFDPDRA